MTLILHEADCPALCSFPLRAIRSEQGGTILSCRHGHPNGHACVCDGYARLKELVEAAEASLLRDGTHEWDRLDAALEPFREEKESLKP
jgi:hypothetical protein